MIKFILFFYGDKPHGLWETITKWKARLNATLSCHMPPFVFGNALTLKLYPTHTQALVSFTPSLHTFSQFVKFGIHPFLYMD